MRRSIVEQADKGGNDSLELFEKGGKAYFDLWDEVRRKAAPRRTSRRSASGWKRSSRTRRAPSRPATSSPSAIKRAHGLAQPELPDGEDRARETGDVRDWRQLAGHRGLRPSGGLVRALRKGKRAPRPELGQGALGRHRAAARARSGRPGRRRRHSVQERLREHERNRDRPDRIRHRRALRRQGRLGRGRKALSGCDGDARQGAARHPGPSARHARARDHGT